MTSIADAPPAASTRASGTKWRRFWLVDFVLSPFADTDERADYMARARRPDRNRGAAAPFRNAAAPIPGRLPGRPAVKRFPRDGE